MKRRRWLVGAAILLTLLGGLDALAWLFATRALRHSIDVWVEQQRATGTAIAVGPMTRGGWPFAATLAFDARSGPGGVPGGMTVQAALVSELSWSHPRVVRTRIDAVRLAAADGVAVVATATRWWIDADLHEPGRADMAADALRLVWPGHAATIASLSAHSAAGPSSAGEGSSRFDLRAGDIDLAASGLSLPAGFGDTIRTIDFLGAVRGGFPPVAATAEASARSWRQAGGGLTIDRLAVSYGAFSASIAGSVGLDDALSLTGTGEAAIGGLLPLLAALGARGSVPSHAAQAAGGVLALLGAGDDGAGATGAGTVRLPVALNDGRVVVAGFPVARLPRLPWQAQPGPAEAPPVR